MTITLILHIIFSVYATILAILIAATLIELVRYKQRDVSWRRQYYVAMSTSLLLDYILIGITVRSFIYGSLLWHLGIYVIVLVILAAITGWTFRCHHCSSSMQILNYF